MFYLLSCLLCYCLTFISVTHFHQRHVVCYLCYFCHFLLNHFIFLMSGVKPQTQQECFMVITPAGWMSPLAGRVTPPVVLNHWKYISESESFAVLHWLMLLPLMQCIHMLTATCSDQCIENSKNHKKVTLASITLPTCQQLLNNVTLCAVVLTCI